MFSELFLINGHFLGVILCLLIIIARIKIFQKAGREWWEAIIPIYCAYVLIKIAGKPGWWLFLYIIPIVNLVIAIKVVHNISRRFGKDGWFTVGLLFLPFIFYPILGFGESSYKAV